MNYTKLYQISQKLIIVIVMLKRLIRVFFLSFENCCFISLINIYKTMSRIKSGSRVCTEAWRFDSQMKLQKNDGLFDRCKSFW